MIIIIMMENEKNLSSEIFSHLQQAHARRGDQLVCVKSRQTCVTEDKIK